MTYFIVLYMLGMVMMWGFIEALDVASDLGRLHKKQELLQKHGVDEKIFLCCIWPLFAVIYMFMTELQRRRDERK